MRWFFNVLSWHFACMALALLVLGSIPLAANVMADSPPLTTGTHPYCPYCSDNTSPCGWNACLGDDVGCGWDGCDPANGGGCSC